MTFHVGNFAEGGREWYLTLDQHSSNTVNFNITTDDSNNANTFNLNTASGDADKDDVANLKVAADDTVDLNIIVDEALGLNVAANDTLGLVIAADGANNNDSFPWCANKSATTIPVRNTGKDSLSCNFSSKLFMAQS